MIFALILLISALYSRLTNLKRVNFISTLYVFFPYLSKSIQCEPLTCFFNYSYSWLCYFLLLNTMDSRSIFLKRVFKLYKLFKFSYVLLRSLSAMMHRHNSEQATWVGMNEWSRHLESQEEDGMRWWRWVGEWSNRESRLLTARTKTHPRHTKPE